MSPDRNYGLDLLRILLCLTVIFFHYSGVWNCGGSVAVDGFFILSGFLAVHSSGGFSQGGVGEYYRKKGWRLLPTMIIVVGLTKGLSYVVLLVKGQQATAGFDFGMLMVAPTLAVVKITGNVVFWFLGCLMAFLVLFPLLRICYGKRIFMWLLVASVLFAAFRSSFRPFAIMDSGGLYYQVTFRLWQFLLGMWCASWNVERWKLSWRWFWIGTGMVWLLASSTISREGIGFLNYSFPGYLVSSGLFALCIVSLWSVRLPSLSSSLLKWIGLAAGMTYALFLFHMPVMQGMARIFRMLRKYGGVDWREDDFPVLFWGMVLCILLLVSYFIYQYVEVLWVGKMLKKEAGARNKVPERAGEE